jgi:hypothetical protein
VVDVPLAVVGLEAAVREGKPSSMKLITGSQVGASESRSQVAAISHWVMQSTALMW